MSKEENLYEDDLRKRAEWLAKFYDLEEEEIIAANRRVFLNNFRKTQYLAYNLRFTCYVTISMITS